MWKRLAKYKTSSYTMLTELQRMLSMLSDYKYATLIR